MADVDGDGQAAWQEYIAGTDPTNSNSVLRLTVAPIGSNRAVVLQFLATTNRSYTVQSRDALGGGAWAAWTNVPSLPIPFPPAHPADVKTKPRRDLQGVLRNSPPLYPP